MASSRNTPLVAASSCNRTSCAPAASGALRNTCSGEHEDKNELRECPSKRTIQSNATKPGMLFASLKLSRAQTSGNDARYRKKDCSPQIASRRTSRRIGQCSFAASAELRRLRAESPRCSVPLCSISQLRDCDLSSCDFRLPNCDCAEQRARKQLPFKRHQRTASRG